MFKDSPFSGWVQAHVEEPARNALCVESAAGLTGSGLRVTRAGQTAAVARHPRSRRHPRRHHFQRGRLAEIDSELARLDQQLVGLGAEVTELDRRSRVLEKSRTAYDAVAAARFDDVDVEGSDRRIAELGGAGPRSWRRTTSSRPFTGRSTSFAEQLEQARRKRFGLEQRQRELNDAHAQLIDSEDLVNDRLEAMERTGTSVLADDQDAALTAEFAAAAAPADPEDLDRFPENSQRLADRLRGAVAEAEAEIQRVDDDLAAIFRMYKFQWDSRRTSAPATYPDYARILDEIRGKGLAERRSEWRRRLTGGAARTWCRWSGPWRPRSRRSRTGSSRSTRSVAASSSGPRATGCGSGSGGWPRRTSRSSARPAGALGGLDDRAGRG